MYAYFGNYVCIYNPDFVLFESTLRIKRVRNNSIIDKAYRLKKDVIPLIILKKNSKRFFRYVKILLSEWNYIY